MDIVFIEKLKIPASIGVWEWERQVKQMIVVDVELGTDIRAAARSDDLDDSISYKDVASKICELLSERHFALIEAVAESIASTVLKNYPVQWCKVCVSKPRAVEKSQNVGVVIERISSSASLSEHSGE